MLWKITIFCTMKVREHRQRILDRDRWRCSKCGNGRPVDVYLTKYAAGPVGPKNMITLCDRCARRHEIVSLPTGQSTKLKNERFQLR